MNFLAFLILFSVQVQAEVSIQGPGLGNQITLSDANIYNYRSIHIISRRYDQGDEMQPEVIFEIPEGEIAWSKTIELQKGAGQYQFDIQGQVDHHSEFQKLGHFSFQNVMVAKNFQSAQNFADLSGRSLPDVELLLLQVKKNGGDPTATSNYFIRNPKQAWSLRVFAREGSGQYEIKLAATSRHEIEMGHLTHTLGTYTLAMHPTSAATLLASGMAQSDQPEILALARLITATAKTKYEKTSLIHDWVALNIAYEPEMLAIDSRATNILKTDALSVLNLKKTICTGYANLTAALLRAVGVDTRIINGTVSASDGHVLGLHAWNEAYVDDRWLILDTTWDSGYVVNDPATKHLVFSPNFRREYFDAKPKDFELHHTAQKIRND